MIWPATAADYKFIHYDLEDRFADYDDTFSEYDQGWEGHALHHMCVLEGDDGKLARDRYGEHGFGNGDNVPCNVRAGLLK